MPDNVVDTAIPAAPAAPAPAAATPAAPAPQAATPSAPPASATPSPVEDRSQWVPPHRLRETREAALRQANTEYGQREAALRAEADRYRQQVMALTGATPPPNPEIQAVRDQFGGLYPGLSKLESKADVLEQLIERASDLEAQTQHYWQQHGQRTLDRLFDHAEKSMGNTLTNDAKRQLYTSFVGYVQSSPETTNRYSNDPTIVDDFWRDFTSSFIDPVRRNASATVQSRAGGNLPQDAPSGSVAVNAAGAPKPKDLDERAAMGWAAYNRPK